MHRVKLYASLMTVAVLAVSLPLSAATVVQLNLEQMVDRADKIFRGTVLDAREGTVQAGGGELPVVTYRLRVDEEFKGAFEEVKGVRIAEVRMLGKLKPASSSGTARSLPPLTDLPRLEVGRDYLLLTTPESAAGLSTTIGLGQGRFELKGKPGQEIALNDNQNRGLFRGMSGTDSFSGGATPQEGPLPYSALASLIRNIVGQ